MGYFIGALLLTVLAVFQASAFTGTNYEMINGPELTPAKQEESLFRQKRFVFLPGYSSLRYLRSADSESYTNPSNPNSISNYWQKRAERRRVRLDKRRKRLQTAMKRQEEFMQDLGKQQTQALKTIQTLSQNMNTRLGGLPLVNANRIMAVSATPTGGAKAVPVSNSVSSSQIIQQVPLPDTAVSVPV